MPYRGRNRYYFNNSMNRIDYSRAGWIADVAKHTIPQNYYHNHSRRNQRPPHFNRMANNNNFNHFRGNPHFHPHRQQEHNMYEGRLRKRIAPNPFTSRPRRGGRGRGGFSGEQRVPNIEKDEYLENNVEGMRESHCPRFDGGDWGNYHHEMDPNVENTNLTSLERMEETLSLRMEDPRSSFVRTKESTKVCQFRKSGIPRRGRRYSGERCFRNTEMDNHLENSNELCLEDMKDNRRTRWDEGNSEKDRPKTDPNLENTSLKRSDSQKDRFHSEKPNCTEQRSFSTKLSNTDQQKNQSAIKAKINILDSDNYNIEKTPLGLGKQVRKINLLDSDIVKETVVCDEGADVDTVDAIKQDLGQRPRVICSSSSIEIESSPEKCKSPVKLKKKSINDSHFDKMYKTGSYDFESETFTDFHFSKIKKNESFLKIQIQNNEVGHKELDEGISNLDSSKIKDKDVTCGLNRNDLINTVRDKKDYFNKQDTVQKEDVILNINNSIQDKEHILIQNVEYNMIQDNKNNSIKNEENDLFQDKNNLIASEENVKIDSVKMLVDLNKGESSLTSNANKDGCNNDDNQPQNNICLNHENISHDDVLLKPKCNTIEETVFHLFTNISANNTTNDKNAEDSQGEKPLEAVVNLQPSPSSIPMTRQLSEKEIECKEADLEAILLKDIEKSYQKITNFKDADEPLGKEDEVGEVPNTLEKKEVHVVLERPKSMEEKQNVKRLMEPKKKAVRGKAKKGEVIKIEEKLNEKKKPVKKEYVMNKSKKNVEEVVSTKSSKVNVKAKDRLSEKNKTKSSDQFLENKSKENTTKSKELSKNKSKNSQATTKTKDHSSENITHAKMPPTKDSKLSNTKKSSSESHKRIGVTEHARSKKTIEEKQKSRPTSHEQQNKSKTEENKSEARSSRKRSTEINLHEAKKKKLCIPKNRKILTDDSDDEHDELLSKINAIITEPLPPSINKKRYSTGEDVQNEVPPKIQKKAQEISNDDLLFTLMGMEGNNQNHDASEDESKGDDIEISATIKLQDLKRAILAKSVSFLEIMRSFNAKNQLQTLEGEIKMGSEDFVNKANLKDENSSADGVNLQQNKRGKVMDTQSNNTLAQTRTSLETTSNDKEINTGVKSTSLNFEENETSTFLTKKGSLDIEMSNREKNEVFLNHERKKADELNSNDKTSSSEIVAAQLKDKTVFVQKPSTAVTIENEKCTSIVLKEALKAVDTVSSETERTARISTINLSKVDTNIMRLEENSRSCEAFVENILVEGHKSASLDKGLNVTRINLNEEKENSLIQTEINNSTITSILNNFTLLQNTIISANENDTSRQTIDHSNLRDSFLIENKQPTQASINVSNPNNAANKSLTEEIAQTTSETVKRLTSGIETSEIEMVKRLTSGVETSVKEIDAQELILSSNMAEIERYNGVDCRQNSNNITQQQSSQKFNNTEKSSVTINPEQEKIVIKVDVDADVQIKSEFGNPIADLFKKIINSKEDSITVLDHFTLFKIVYPLILIIYSKMLATHTSDLSLSLYLDNQHSTREILKRDVEKAINHLDLVLKTVDVYEFKLDEIIKYAKDFYKCTIDEFLVQAMVSLSGINDPRTSFGKIFHEKLVNACFNGSLKDMKLCYKAMDVIKGYDVGMLEGFKEKLKGLFVKNEFIVISDDEEEVENNAGASKRESSDEGLNGGRVSGNQLNGTPQAQLNTGVDLEKQTRGSQLDVAPQTQVNSEVKSREPTKGNQLNTPSNSEVNFQEPTRETTLNTQLNSRVNIEEQAKRNPVNTQLISGINFKEQPRGNQPNVQQSNSGVHFEEHQLNAPEPRAPNYWNPFPYHQSQYPMVSSSGFNCNPPIYQPVFNRNQHQFPTQPFPVGIRTPLLPNVGESSTTGMNTPGNMSIQQQHNLQIQRIYEQHRINAGFGRGVNQQQLPFVQNPRMFQQFPPRSTTQNMSPKSLPQNCVGQKSPHIPRMHPKTQRAQLLKTSSLLSQHRQQQAPVVNSTQQRENALPRNILEATETQPQQQNPRLNQVQLESQFSQANVAMCDQRCQTVPTSIRSEPLDVSNDSALEAFIWGNDNDQDNPTQNNQNQREVSNANRNLQTLNRNVTSSLVNSLEGLHVPVDEISSETRRSTPQIAQTEQGIDGCRNSISENPVPERTTSTDSGCFLSPILSEERSIKPDSSDFVFLADRKYECICGKDADLLCECNQAIYCSVDCQVANWAQHRQMHSATSEKTFKK